ncbi:MAG: sigma-54-dependent transcriptional regulator [Burkholderiales bacterium]
MASTQPAQRTADGPRRRTPRILVVDDEADIRELLELTLVRMGLTVDLAPGVEAAKVLIAEHSYDLCLTDMRMTDGNGLDLVRHVAQNCKDLPIAVITAHGTADNAVAALKAGAFDYLSKPVGLDQLRTLVKSAIDVPATKLSPESGRGLIGNSSALVETRDLIGRVARSFAPVHICGESGTGKELAARLLHEQSLRSGAFVAVNCGAIPENLMESEFFGYRKGAFTGAGEDRDGFFQAATNGTLFLDEVAELPLAMQVKLLRAIQEKQVRRVGATAEERIDARIVSATHQNLAALTAAGKFRQDLLYRLNVIEIRTPSLRECREDIADIARAFIARAALNGNPDLRVADAAIAALERYDFPGNVRELENILERAIALARDDEIVAEDLRLIPALSEDTPRVAGGGDTGGLPLPDYLDCVEREAIQAALREAGDNRTAAARLLGVTFRSLRYRLQRLGID